MELCLLAEKEINVRTAN